MAELKLRGRLGEINVPTLVIGGDRDITVGINNILAEFQALPKSKRHLHIYHDIGRSPNVEVGDSVAGLLGDFSVLAGSLDLQSAK